jgi:hypothetical protein
MDLRALVERVKQLVLAPRETLPLTLAESGDPKAVLVPMVVVLAALGPVAGFLSQGVVGTYVPPQTIFNTTVPAMYVRAPGIAALIAVLRYALGIGAWWLLAQVLDKLAPMPMFGGKSDLGGAYKTSAAMLTPIWLAGVLGILSSVPYLDALTFLGGIAGLVYAVLIGIYAVPLHLSVPEPKAIGHVLAALGVTVVATALSYVLLTTLLLRPFLG